VVCGSNLGQSTESIWAAFAEAIVIWDWEGLLVAFPVVTYGFTAHHFLFGINSSLRQSSVKRMSLVVRRVSLPHSKHEQRNSGNDVFMAGAFVTATVSGSLLEYWAVCYGI
jgi:hypothetical protein